MFWFAVIIVLIFGFVVFRGSPYVPSRKRYINQAFTELYAVSKKDFLVDIGSGDGIVLREAAKLGARAIGYEINPILVVIANLISIKNPKVKTNLADFWFARLPDETTLVYVFSVQRDIKRLANKLQKEVNRIGEPIHLISYAGDFDQFRMIKKKAAYRLYLISPLQPRKAQV
ncbi:MAG: hypothetical protein WCP11_02825 [Candidatus Saccharibacteria bacterium]